MKFLRFSFYVLSITNDFLIAVFYLSKLRLRLRLKADYQKKV